MKTYLILSEFDGIIYNVQTVNTTSKKKAREIALERGAWTSCKVIEIDTVTENGGYDEYKEK